ncbi:hypothetical protein ACVW1A_007842 [Bradyrhizobium sp. LB1.3]|jgi:hypothetical protein|uniref:hypothetical protein n=1 Tax=unclassified Bradyrhizobium TaxID=2631580 RepID=UPI00339ADBCE
MSHANIVRSFGRRLMTMKMPSRVFLSAITRLSALVDLSTLTLQGVWSGILLSAIQTSVFSQWMAGSNLLGGAGQEPSHQCE